MNNPLDDDLLKELGLEPRGEEKAPSAVEQSLSKKKAPEKKAVPEAEKTVISQNAGSVADKNAIDELPVQIAAVLAKRSMPLKDIFELKSGEIIDMKKMPGDLIDLVANGKLVARGELVLIDGRVGVQIRQILS